MISTQASLWTSSNSAVVKGEATSIETNFVEVEFAPPEPLLTNSMSVDVEEYFHVSAFEHQISRSSWNSMPSRLSRNINRILQLFGENNVKATFFVLGWVAKTQPDIIKAIVSDGHEIASHGLEHSRVWTQTPKQYLHDVSCARKTLEDITGSQVIGYRAPSFSIDTRTLWAYDVLLEAGYKYSSSIYPIAHDHYGLPAAPRHLFRYSKNGMLEVPLSTVALNGRNWPCAGGGYFRLLPLAYSRWALNRVIRVEKKPVNFYFHPWELDPEQPKVPGISLKSRFRHYVNLGKFERRLVRILGEFRWSRIDQVFRDAL